MNDMYVRDTAGNFVLDRRRDSMEIQQSVFKLIASVESLKENVEISLESVKDKISNLDTKIGDKLQIVQNTLIQNEEEHLELIEKVNKHENNIREYDRYLEDINLMKTTLVAYKEELLNIKKELYKLKDDQDKASLRGKAAIIDGFMKIFRVVVYTSLASGIVAFILFLLKEWFLKGVMT